MSLPESVLRIVEAIGDDAALRLIAAVGGKRVYIPLPGRPMPDIITQAIGVDAAERLRALLAPGVRHEFPRCVHAGKPARDAALRAERAAGASVQALADKYQLTARFVRSVTNRP